MSDFNPYAAPESEISPGPSRPLGEGVWRDGDVLVCTKNAEFPDRCLKCNESANGYRLKRTLRWHPQGYYILILSPIIYLVVALIVWKRAKVALPLCETHRLKRVRALALAWILPVVGVAVMPLGIGLASGAGDLRNNFEMGAVALGFILIIGGLAFGIVGSQVTSPRKIDARFAWLEKVSPAFLAGLPVFRG